MDEQVMKWGAAIFISYFVIRELLKFIHLMWKGRESLVDYVRKDDCKSFKTRIGHESDEHRSHIFEIKSDISEIKSGIGYIKGRLE